RRRRRRPWPAGQERRRAGEAFQDRVMKRPSETLVSFPAWRGVPRVEFHRLRAAREQAHHGVQWLARAARAYVPARPDDSHTNLGWDGAFGGLMTHALPDGTRLGLRLVDLTLSLLGETPRELPLDGRADAEVRAWLGKELGGRGLDANKLDQPAPYGIPPHVLALGARYSLDELQDPFRVLATWYENASGMLAHVQQKLAARKLMSPPVRCWPHHFDLDCIVSFGRDRGMGIGFSPGDEYCDEPYFYVTIYP